MGAYQVNVVRNMRENPRQKKCSPQRVDLCWYHGETGCGKEKKAALKASRTRAAKANVQEDYTAKDKEVNKSIRKDKRDHIDNLVKQAKEAAGQGNLRELYMVTMKLSNKFQQTYKPEKDKNRNLLQ